MKIKIEMDIDEKQIEHHNKECIEMDEEHRVIKTEKELNDLAKEVLEDFLLND